MNLTHNTSWFLKYAYSRNHAVGLGGSIICDRGAKNQNSFVIWWCSMCVRLIFQRLRSSRLLNFDQSKYSFPFVRIQRASFFSKKVKVKDYKNGTALDEIKDPKLGVPRSSTTSESKRGFSKRFEACQCERSHAPITTFPNPLNGQGS